MNPADTDDTHFWWEAQKGITPKHSSAMNENNKKGKHLGIINPCFAVK